MEVVRAIYYLFSLVNAAHSKAHGLVRKDLTMRSPLLPYNLACTLGGFTENVIVNDSVDNIYVATTIGQILDVSIGIVGINLATFGEIKTDY